MSNLGGHLCPLLHWCLHCCDLLACNLGTILPLHNGRMSTMTEAADDAINGMSAVLREWVERTRTRTMPMREEYKDREEGGAEGNAGTRVWVVFVCAMTTRA